jgi:hypothetical protein
LPGIVIGRAHLHVAFGAIELTGMIEIGRLPSAGCMTGGTRPVIVVGGALGAVAAGAVSQSGVIHLRGLERAGRMATLT